MPIDEERDEERELLEEQLRTGEFIEPEEEVAVDQEEDQVPEVPEELSQEDLQERLAALQRQLEEKDELIKDRSGALSEERDRRRGLEGQYAQLMDYIQEARNRASQVQEQRDQEEYSEYDEYLQAVEKRYGPVMRSMMERQAQVEQLLNQQYQMQHQVQQFAQQSQQYLSQKPDYNDAMNFLVERVRQRAGLFYQDPQQREAVVAQEAQRLIQFSPDQLYNLARVDGYVPQQGETTVQAGNPGPQPQTTRPKSLANIAGATGVLPDSVEAKATKIAQMSYSELDKIPLEELDQILKKLSR